jgi:hypothetical protein
MQTGIFYVTRNENLIKALDEDKISDTREISYAKIAKQFPADERFAVVAVDKLTFAEDIETHTTQNNQQQTINIMSPSYDQQSALFLLAVSDTFSWTPAGAFSFAKES